MTLSLLLLGLLTLAVLVLSIGVWLWRLSDPPPPVAPHIAALEVPPMLRSVTQRRSGRWHRSATVEDDR
jgi:hypothetical protein